MSIVLAGTGHRPQKLGGFNADTYRKLDQLALEYLVEHEEITQVISGMALGWDMALARAALNLCIPLVAAVPFIGQEKKWWDSGNQKVSMELINEYERILKLADRIEIISEGGYAAWKMIKRNHWMVDNCDKVAALWDGKPKGGTAKTVAYAHLKRKPVIQLWSNFKAL